MSTPAAGGAADEGVPRLENQRHLPGDLSASWGSGLGCEGGPIPLRPLSWLEPPDPTRSQGTRMVGRPGSASVQRTVWVLEWAAGSGTGHRTGV